MSDEREIPSDHVVARRRAVRARSIVLVIRNSNEGVALKVLPDVAVTFSAVIALIADLDRPQEGTLTVSQQALIDLRQSMNPPER